MKLSELDDLYRTTVSKLPKDQRLWYCVRHLEKLQFMFNNNWVKMTFAQQTHMQEMIAALQEEIEILQRAEQ